MLSNAPPTLAEIEQIAGHPDAVIRNLLITQCYHELSLVLTNRTGVISNWCTFATWASKQAGQTIRKEDLSRKLEVLLGKDLLARQALGDLQTSLPARQAAVPVEKFIQLAWSAFDPPALFDRSSQAVAHGNLKVFKEIGREFARFYSTCLDDPFPDEENLASFLAGLRPGDPPEGQGYLREAFTNYYRALFEPDWKLRLELILLANLEIGYHEQTRLQPEILESLTAPVISPETFANNLMNAVNPQWTWLNKLIWYLLRLFGRLTTLDLAIAAYHAAAQREAHFIITDTLMTIDLPGTPRLRLGSDLTAAFPDDLLCISNPNLLALLATIDPTQDSTHESGAEYWGDLMDRLHFIADMFRCYHLSPALLDPPFTAQQVTALKQGCLPPGRL